MWDLFTMDNNSFVPYNTEHMIVLIMFLVLSCIFLIVPKYWTHRRQTLFITSICVISFGLQLFKLFYRLYAGSFDHTEDLPLHLCNMLPWIMIYVMYTRNRFLFGIFFFWIIAGTSQSLLTPTHDEAFPHYESWRYWIVHGGLTLVALYGVFIYRWRLDIRDAVRSAIGLNMIAAFMYPINLILDTNYMYLIAKPPGKTLYDILGPWPWYIISLEVVIVVLFGLLLIPFYLIRKR